MTDHAIGLENLSAMGLVFVGAQMNGVWRGTTYGIISYGNGWRKAVVNQRLDLSMHMHMCKFLPVA